MATKKNPPAPKENDLLYKVYSLYGAVPGVYIYGVTKSDIIPELETEVSIRMDKIEHEYPKASVIAVHISKGDSITLNTYLLKEVPEPLDGRIDIGRLLEVLEEECITYEEESLNSDWVDIGDKRGEALIFFVKGAEMRRSAIRAKRDALEQQLQELDKALANITSE